jgi:transposase
MAVERVQEGEAPSAVIASYGFCHTTIYKWLRKVRRGGRGDPLLSSKGTGRPPKLTGKQERQVFRWINGKDPQQYGFDFGLCSPQDSPHLSNRTKNVCEERLIMQHEGKALHQWAEPLFSHGGHEVVEHAALTEQRMDAVFGSVGFQHAIVSQRLTRGTQQG